MAAASSGSSADLSASAVVVGVPEVGVLVQRHLAVQGDDLALGGLHQRVDLDQGGVLALVHLAEQLQHAGDLGGVVTVEPGGGDDLVGLGLVDADVRVDRDPGQRLGTLDGELLDLHAALSRAHGEVAAVGAVEQQGEVVLLGDVRRPSAIITFCTTWPLMSRPRMSGGLLGRLLRGLRDLDAARLAATAGLDLCLDHHDRAADLRRRGRRLLRGDGGDAAQDGNPVFLEDVSRLVLVQIHSGLHVRVRPAQPVPGRGERASSLAFGPEPSGPVVGPDRGPASAVGAGHVLPHPGHDVGHRRRRG